MDRALAQGEEGWLDGVCESEYGDDKFRIEVEVGMLPCSAVLEAGLCHTDGSRDPHSGGAATVESDVSHVSDFCTASL